MAEYTDNPEFKARYGTPISKDYQWYLKAEGNVGRYILMSPRFLGKAALTAAKTAIYPIKSAAVGEFPALPKKDYFATDLKLTDKDGMPITLVDAVCNIVQTNTLVTTPLVGLAGTIKEGVNVGDYTIIITAGLIANTLGDWEVVDHYPQQDLKTLARMLNKPDPIKVESAYLALFGIQRIVVEKFDIKQTSASNRQEVEITAKSDEDYTINYNK